MRTVLIGGTGTLGRELARQLDGSCEIAVFSRDELKQHEMRRDSPRIEYRLGDIRDADAVRSALAGAHRVFLLAAIKHIDAAEENPLEAIKTNVLGAVNVAEAAIAMGVPYVIFSNTDKSVLPITTYGYTKALAQNYLLSLNQKNKTRFSVFNWGNVIASRGSVVPLFVRSLAASRTIQITAAEMSRFWITIQDAASFMLDNYPYADPDRAMIPPIKGARVIRIAETIAKIMGIPAYKVDLIGLRCIEKFHEVLESRHDGCLRSDTCEQYTDAELYFLLHGVVTKEMTACGFTSMARTGTWAEGTAPSLMT